MRTKKPTPAELRSKARALGTALHSEALVLLGVSELLRLGKVTEAFFAFRGIMVNPAFLSLAEGYDAVFPPKQKEARKP